MFLYLKENIRAQDFTLISSFCFRCLHVLKISCLLFMVLLSWLCIIWYFSFRHNLHFFVIGLNIVALSIKSHSTSKSFPLSFRLHACVLSLVLIRPLVSLMSLLCPFHRALKVLPVIPVYVCLLPDAVSVTVALYTTLSVRHLPCTGQVAGPAWQLHPGCCWGCCCWLLLCTLALCVETAWAMFGIHL